MAQKTQTTITYYSDLSGQKIGEDVDPTFSFGWGGDEYRIDLTNAEADKFVKLLQPYLDAATKVSRRAVGRRKSSGSSKASDTAQIRAWAKSNGIPVSERGRIPAEVREKFDAAN